MFMSRMREDVDIGVRAIKRLAVPHHTLRSWLQVAKRERLTDDKLTRALARLTEFVGGALTEVRDNRLVPTTLGHDFCKAAEPLLNLGQGETIEVLAIGITPAVDPALVARAVIKFSRKWRELVGFKLAVFPSGIREAVESDQAAFGIADGSELDEADERLKLTVPLVALLPDGHRLADACGLLDSDHFSPHDQVLFSPRLAEPLGDVLGRVPAVNRVVVECPNTLHVLVENGAGIGFEYAQPGRSGSGAITRVSVLGVEPLALGLVLPRKRERLTDPACYFLDVLRRAPEPSLPTVPANDTPAVPELLPIPDPVSA
jgi:DNA-binding transcriptional LysR family regulator